MNRTSREEVINSYYYIDDVPEEKREEEIKSFERQKDKYVAAYLKARGFRFRGVEKIIIKSAHNREKCVVAFCFPGDGVTRKAILEYWNNDDNKNHNVNALLMFTELKNINSIIANF